jgi:hypothetical protein
MGNESAGGIHVMAATMMAPLRRKTAQSAT